MANKKDRENNDIGYAILYYRDAYKITQKELCKGLCSVSTLSRIEGGERDADALILETLLERLGKTPNYFELILSEFDYVAYQMREQIEKYIREENYHKAQEYLKEYETLARDKPKIHNQFIVRMRAYIEDCLSDDYNTVLELLMEAISYTVPGFRTNRIQDYYLSQFEMSIIIDIIQRMIKADMREKAKNILDQVLEYFHTHIQMEEDYSLYPKAAIIAAKIYMQEQDWRKTLDICNLGIDKNKDNRKMDDYGDLYYLKAKALEALYKNTQDWANYRRECHRLCIQAYYMYMYCGESVMEDEVRIHLKEEYQWDDIDWGTSSK